MGSKFRSFAAVCTSALFLGCSKGPPQGGPGLDQRGAASATLVVGPDSGIVSGPTVGEACALGDGWQPQSFEAQAKVQAAVGPTVLTVGNSFTDFHQIAP